MMGIVTVMIAFCILANVDSAFASNADSDWSFNLLQNELSYHYTDTRVKDSDSKYYFYWSGSLNTISQIHIIPLGRKSISGDRVPCCRQGSTAITEVTAKNRGQYRITNYVKENGYSYACIGMRGAKGSGTASGKWSPDTGTNYPILY